MRKRSSLLVPSLVAAVAFVVAGLGTTPVQASPEDDYVGPYFGDGNLPPGCVKDYARDNPANICYHAKTGLNALDSPKVDVAVLVPASPTAERDLRIMKQAADSWAGGIHYLADEMGLDWVRDGVEFTITPHIVEAAGKGLTSTYPLYDPEIVILASNPAGGIGIGIDPVDFSGNLIEIFAPGSGARDVPCHTVENPFSLESWEGMPGYDGHHGDGGGYYVEDCGGAGGNVCFSVNGAVDPVPGKTDAFSLYDLVLHETGHCLTLGHVGDGAEGSWGPVPTTDIMAYSYDPPGQSKCVSTLNVEAFAIRMSKYIDVNGDGAVDAADHVHANDAQGDGYPFQVQHPDDHRYASSTGSVWDCPQPDVGTTPGDPVDFSPDPVETSDPVLDVTSPAHGAETADGHVHVAGTVERRSHDMPPTASYASVDDPEGDADTAYGDLQNVQVDVSALEVTATLKVKELWPSGVASLPQFSVSIDGRQFDSKIGESGNVITADHSMETLVPSEWSRWDAAAETVTFRIPRSYLADAKVTAPYDVFALSGTSTPNKTWTITEDDRAPDAGVIAVAGPESAAAGTSASGTSGSGGSTAALLNPVMLERPGGNTFTAADSTLGQSTAARHRFTLDVPERSDVELVLGWPDASDLDLYVSGATTGQAASTSQPERLVLTGVQGTLAIEVDPYLVTGVPSTTYTLRATTVPTGTSGGGEDPPTAPAGTAADEKVTVYVDGAVAGSDVVESSHGVDSFGVDVQVPTGVHEIRTIWTGDDGEVLGTDVREVVHTAAGVDRDGDRVADSTDNCERTPNATQADLDRDGRGDACDSDIDGDGHSNDKETRAGTDPYDSSSYPRKARLTGL